ncbi:hypothetical protein GBA52_003867 [Prunus armeniaca]|nr:hypothetical protein GBA52_003867 [Prunus armeniaca]
MDGWATFHQDPKNITIFQNAVVQGSKSILFGEPVLPKFNDETHADLYGIEVVIAFRERVANMSSQVMCNLNLPLSFSGTSWDSYKLTKCYEA